MAQCWSHNHQHHLQNLHLFNILWDRVSWLFLHGLPLCPFLYRSLGCPKLSSDFHLSFFGHCSCGPASLPDYHENYQWTWAWYSPLRFNLTLSDFWPLLMLSSLPAWSSRELSDLSGFKPDGPSWVALGHRSHSPASPPDHHKKHLIWVDSILIVSTGFKQFPPEFPLSFIGRTICANCTYIVHYLHSAWLRTVRVYPVTLFHYFRYCLNISFLYF